MSKRIRHKKILELVSTQRVQNQAQLQSMLEHEGLAVTQSTLSRDIKELNLVKGNDGYRTASSVQMLPTGRGALAEALVRYLVRAIVAQNLVLLKTAPGEAHPLAIALDHSEMPAILGTLAGDDTVLIVTSDSNAATALSQELVGMARGV
jgi:transcriptional regulator of arginine metabolism